MSVLTRVWFGDGKDARLMYDFATKRFITYRLPKSISKWAMVIMAIGAATAASPYAFSQLIRSSSEYSDKIQPMKYRPDLWKILLIYLAIIFIITIFFQFFIEKQVERAGIIDANVTDMEKIQKYVHAAVNIQRNSVRSVITINAKNGTSEFKKEYSRKMSLVGIGCGIMMIICFCLLINTTKMVDMITSSLIFVVVMALLIYSVLVISERRIIEKKYNIDINSED
ncbi:hypothetical protein [Bombilactobacillus thymidiniphilus]|uniref:Uncharacterized protein n=1 Tax=Bombilactobacillus thymidiniphilus TaxID=2923363 RepID=A0ABY4PBS4_9LACO|nr:hypothetical protein [Bombilactobacillus thymidiniphilus]UQS82987.1 hypothetical protein MOO47_04185 [Bombilactobacillus thymidiniphilus]